MTNDNDLPSLRIEVNEESLRRFERSLAVCLSNASEDVVVWAESILGAMAGLPRRDRSRSIPSMRFQQQGPFPERNEPILCFAEWRHGGGVDARRQAWEKLKREGFSRIRPIVAAEWRAPEVKARVVYFRSPTGVYLRAG